MFSGILVSRLFRVFFGQVRTVYTYSQCDLVRGKVGGKHECLRVACSIMWYEGLRSYIFLYVHIIYFFVDLSVGFDSVHIKRSSMVNLLLLSCG